MPAATSHGSLARHRMRVGRWVVAVASHIGRKRQENQDAWFAGPVRGPDGPHVAFGVFDGLGGMAFGADAAWAAADAVPEAAAHASEPAALLGRLNAHVGPTQGATTALLALFPHRGVDAGRGLLVSAGDSGAFVADADGVPRLAIPLDRAEGTTNVLTQCLGEGDPRAHVVPVDVAPGRVVVLATDGVFDVVPAASLAPAFASEDVLEALDGVLEAVLAAGAPDNATLVAGRFLG